MLEIPQYLPVESCIHRKGPSFSLDGHREFPPSINSKTESQGKYLGIHYEFHVIFLDASQRNSPLAYRLFPIRCQPKLLSISLAGRSFAKIQYRYAEFVGHSDSFDQLGKLSGSATLRHTVYISSFFDSSTALPVRLKLQFNVVDSEATPPRLKDIHIKMWSKSEVTISQGCSQNQPQPDHTFDTYLRDLCNMNLTPGNTFWDKDMSKELSYSMILDIPIIMSPKWELKPSFESCIASRQYWMSARLRFASTVFSPCDMIFPFSVEPSDII